MVNKPKMAIYWAASCGGCEVALLNLHQQLLELAEKYNIVYCPCLLDVKTEVIAALTDNSIDVTLFNGAIRNDDNAHMARLLRRVSRTLVAFGSCAAEGCVPGLSNLHTRDDHFRDIYLDRRFNDNPAGLLPSPTTATRWGDLHLPEFHHCVTTLADHVPVDLILPGCPPESQRILELLTELQESGAGCGQPEVRGSSTVCAECPRTRDGRKVGRLQRIHQLLPDEAHCLLEQGVVCRGVATREGCGALCPQVNMPCSGCYGAPEGMADQGAAMVGALAGVMGLDPDDYPGTFELAAQTELLLDAVPDLAGQFYTYSLAASLLKGKR